MGAPPPAPGQKTPLTLGAPGGLGTLVSNSGPRDGRRLSSPADAAARRGFRTILTGPPHPYGDGLWPIPGLGVGYGETKIIECHDLMEAIVAGVPGDPSFEDGYRIACISDAALQSAEAGGWGEGQSEQAAAAR